jgi:outer membrane murein-binding lipoprotein Lpp
MDRVEGTLGRVADRLEQVGERMGQLAVRMDQLTGRVDQLTERVDQLAVRMDQLAVRMEQLTERVDQLTERVDQLAERMDQLTGRVDQLAVRMDQLTGRVDQLAKRMDQLTGRVDQLAERMDQLTGRVDQLAEQVDQLTSAVRAMVERQDRVDGELANIRGDLLEARFERNLGNWLREWARRPRKVLVDDLALLDEALAGGLVTEDEVRQIAALDFLVQGRDRDTARELFFAVEVSHTVNTESVERAATRAAILRKAGYEARGLVTGHRISETAEALAERLGTVALVRTAA